MMSRTRKYSNTPVAEYWNPLFSSESQPYARGFNGPQIWWRMRRQYALTAWCGLASSLYWSFIDFTSIHWEIKTHGSTPHPTQKSVDISNSDGVNCRVDRWNTACVTRVDLPRNTSCRCRRVYICQGGDRSLNYIWPRGCRGRSSMTTECCTVCVLSPH